MCRQAANQQQTMINLQYEVLDECATPTLSEDHAAGCIAVFAACTNARTFSGSLAMPSGPVTPLETSTTPGPARLMACRQQWPLHARHLIGHHCAPRCSQSLLVVQTVRSTSVMCGGADA